MIFDRVIELSDETLTINWLMYKSYEFQRDNAPNVSAERWQSVYLFQEDYEKVYQDRHSIHMEVSYGT